MSERKLAVPQSRWVKESKSYLYPGQGEMGGRVHVCMCEEKAMCNGSNFPTFWQALGVMLFIFGKLHMSERARPRRSGTYRVLWVSSSGQKSCGDVPGLDMLTHSALLYNSPSEPWGLALSTSLPLAPFSLYISPSVDFTIPNILALLLSSPLSHFSPISLHAL